MSRIKDGSEMTQFKVILFGASFLALSSATPTKADKFLNIRCPEMQDRVAVPLKVSVTFDQASRRYNYRYSIPATEGAVASLMLSDMASDASVISSEAWRSCNGAHGALVCLGLDKPAASRGNEVVVQSVHPPAMILYSLISPYDGKTAFDVNQAEMRNENSSDISQVKDIVDNEMEAQCPYGQAGNDFGRGATGVVAGPSDRVAIQIRDTKISDNSYEIVLVGSRSHNLDRIPEAGFGIRDSSRKNLKLTNTPEPVRTEKPESDLKISFSRPSACNARGVILDVNGGDGIRYRAGLSISASSCADRIQEISVKIPNVNSE